MGSVVHNVHSIHTGLHKVQMYAKYRRTQIYKCTLSYCKVQTYKCIAVHKARVHNVHVCTKIKVYTTYKVCTRYRCKVQLNVKHTCVHIVESVQEHVCAQSIDVQEHVWCAWICSHNHRLAYDARSILQIFKLI